ncbi:MAG: HDOD domain-containing protein [Desulfovibrionaceae bacterium]|nr:HDOD domain-containing protein [Desulfovibrionaceae bacterium]
MFHDQAQKLLIELSNIKHDLPFSPVLLQKLFVQTGERSLASLEDIAMTVSKDQGLTTKILAVANSAFYGLQSQVTSVGRAAAVLGLKEIRNIVVSLGIRTLTRKRPVPEEFKLLDYWKHQFFVALIAKSMAQGMPDINSDNMFTAGLLHDLGKLIVAMYRPERWVEINALAAKLGLSDSEAEDRYWGLDHGVVGSLTLKSWDFPPELCEPVNWHHSPELAPEFKAEASLLCLADGLAHCMIDPKGTYVQAVETVCAGFGLDPAAVEADAAEVLDEAAVDHFVSMLV